MNSELLTRIFWSLAIIIAGGLIFLTANKLILYLAEKRTRPLPGSSVGKPAILYFTTPDCIVCHTIQRPALQQIRSHFGAHLEVIEVDATRQPDMVKDWGVLSVPTTFIIDRQGKPKFVNHGAARAEKLLDQLKRIGF